MPHKSTPGGESAWKEKLTRQKMVKSDYTPVNTADMNGLNGVMQADTRNIVLLVAMFLRHSIKESCFE